MVARSRNGKDATKQITGEDVRRERFGSYFPHLFAYISSLTDDDERAREIAVESFARVLSNSAVLSDEEFPLALFGVAREICHRESPSTKQLEDGLNAREREVLALLFDAQLNRSQVCDLMKIKEDALMAALLKGLRKLRAAMTPVQAPAFFRLT